jgi:hypothetical protein
MPVSFQPQFVYVAVCSVFANRAEIIEIILTFRKVGGGAKQHEREGEAGKTRCRGVKQNNGQDNTDCGGEKIARTAEQGFEQAAHQTSRPL